MKRTVIVEKQYHYSLISFILALLSIFGLGILIGLSL